KPPDAADKPAIARVRGVEHEERDCATDMAALFMRMQGGLAKMEPLDKFVANNIRDAIKIAQNTDATPENPNLATTGDSTPGIEDKMRAAQADIGQFRFGTAMGKQQNCETALERIIVVLSRRREPDAKLEKQIAELARDLQRILNDQRELTKRT